jgi:hypothetical protein
MEKEKRGWLVRDKRRLLVRMMEQLAGNAHISFEGDLKALHLSRIPGASNEETEVLKRNTLSPKQVFVVLPLETSSTKTIIAAIGGTIPSAIIHVQIEKGGCLQFAAYDNFHPQCIVFHPAMDRAIIELLIAEGVMRP